jgi:threonine/homoserine/homoserine lactone efflux protein
MWDAIFPYVAALLPTLGVAVLFYFVIKAILEGDRRERLAQSKWEKERDRRDENTRSNSPPGSD